MEIPICVTAYNGKSPAQSSVELQWVTRSSDNADVDYYSSQPATRGRKCRAKLKLENMADDLESMLRNDKNMRKLLRKLVREGKFARVRCVSKIKGSWIRSDTFDPCWVPVLDRARDAAKIQVHSIACCLRYRLGGCRGDLQTMTWTEWEHQPSPKHLNTLRLQTWMPMIKQAST
jgi:hypothetical protein